jgi:hypothetical protein
MCVPLRQRDPKVRYLMVIANLCLAAGIMTLNFTHVSGKPHHEWLDAVCGLLMGVSVGINLLCLRMSRRRRPSILNGL